MSNSNQEIIEARLTAYIDGEQDATERLEIEKYLQQNPQHRKMLEELRKGRELLRGLPRVAAPPEFAEAFSNQLERAGLLDYMEPKNPRMRVGAGPRIFAAAAILFLTFGLAAIVYFVLPGRAAKRVAVAPLKPTVAPAPTPAQLSAPAPEEVASANADEPKQAPAAAPAAPLPSTAPNGIEVATADGVPKNTPADAASSPVQANALALATANRAQSRKSETDYRLASLNDLARNLSQDQQVKDLLTGAAKPNAQASATEPAISNEAVVMVVRSSDVQQARKELDAYFRSRNIDWQAAAAPAELALNAPAAPGQGETENKLDEKRASGDPKRDKAAEAPSSKFAQKQAAAGEAPFVRERQLQANAQDELAKGSAPAAMKKAPSLAGGKPGVPPAPAAAPFAPAAPKSAPAPVAGGVPAPSPVPPASAVAADHAAPRVLRQTQEQSDRAQNGAALKNLYVARRLSPSQATDLNAFLARNGPVSQAYVAPQLNDQENNGNLPVANSGNAASNAAASANDAIAAEANPDLANVAHSRGAKFGSATQPTVASEADKDSTKDDAVLKDTAGLGGAATRPADPIVQKGDAIRLRYAATEKSAQERVETLKVKEDGTIEPRALAAAKTKTLPVAGKHLSEIEKALEQPAASVAGADAPGEGATVKVERVTAAPPGADAGRAQFGSAHPKPTTQPSEIDQLAATRAIQRRMAPAAPGAALPPTVLHPQTAPDAQRAIDVVILVQQDEAATPRPIPLPTTSPTTAPTTVPAALVPAPASQPAPAQLK